MNVNRAAMIAVASISISFTCGVVVYHEVKPRAPVTMSAEWGIPVTNCAWCGGYRGRDLEVHHVQPQHVRPDLAHDKSNMIVLCRKCHLCIGHRMNFNSDGVTNIWRMIEEGKR